MQRRLRNRTAFKRRSRLTRRRGAMLVLVALSMVAFLATVAFSVDIAYMQLVRTRLRTATDAAARASGEALSRLQNIDAARQAAKDIAEENLVAGDPLLLDDADIVFGHSSRTGTGAWTFDPTGTPINSIQISGRATGPRHVHRRGSLQLDEAGSDDERPDNVQLRFPLLPAARPGR